jgi:pimeloyl-ACP methyl ester carboxylesterase
MQVRREQRRLKAMTLRHFQVPTRHGPLACSRIGSGPPLVLLPANGHDARDFDAIRAGLVARFETLAFDWPAMGASPPLARPEEASAPLFAEALEDAVAALSFEPSVFVGHSVGGFAAGRLAARRPDRVRALVLVDAGGFDPIGAVGAAFCRLKGTKLAIRLGEGAFARWHAKRRNPHVLAMLERIDAARGGGAYSATVAAVWRSFAEPGHDLRTEATSIRCPTLLVWGALDPVIPARSAGRAVQRAIAGSRLVVLQTGHSPFVEAPEEFLAELVPFLEEIAAVPDDRGHMPRSEATATSC